MSLLNGNATAGNGAGLRYAALSDAGRRDHNEDRHGCFPEQGLFIVADGVGGYACGEVAAHLAVDTLATRDRQGYDLLTALAEAHDRVCRAAGHAREGMVMGAAVVVARITADGQVTLAWVGDSRAYLWSEAEQRLQCLSRDHTLAQQRADHGEISAAALAAHPERRILTRALGFPTGPLQAEAVRFRLHARERLLLCSDGLSDFLDEAAITRILTPPCPDQARVSALVATALAEGGHDNITVVLVAPPPGVPPRGDSLCHLYPKPLVAAIPLMNRCRRWLGGGLFWGVIGTGLLGLSWWLARI